MTPPIKLVTRSGESFQVSEGTGAFIAIDIFALSRTVTMFLTPGEAEALGTALVKFAQIMRQKK